MSASSFSSHINRLTAEFTDIALEKEFWQRSSYGDKLACYVIYGISLFGALIFMFNDIIIFGKLDFLSPLMTVRFISGLSIIVLLLVVYKSNRAETIQHTSNVWLFILISFVYYINSTRPSDYYHHVLIDLLVVTFMFLFLPNSFKSKILWGIIYTVVVLTFLEFFRPEMPVIAKRLTYFVFISAFIAGVTVSYQMKIRQRRLFWALKQQSELSAELEVAWP